jgi:hypothetical protein
MNVGRSASLRAGALRRPSRELAERKMKTMNAYDTDLYEWTRAQADALRRRAANEIDWDNVAEEIESLGRNDRRQIEHRLENLILHLIKWKYQSDWQAPVGRAARSSKLGIGLRA